MEMDKPGLNWTPVRFAPLRYQAISGPFRKHTLTGEAIEAFVLETVKDPSIIHPTSAMKKSSTRIRLMF